MLVRVYQFCRWELLKSLHNRWYLNLVLSVWGFLRTGLWREHFLGRLLPIPNNKCCDVVMCMLLVLLRPTFVLTYTRFQVPGLVPLDWIRESVVVGATYTSYGNMNMFLDPIFRSRGPSPDPGTLLISSGPQVFRICCMMFVKC